MSFFLKRTIQPPSSRRLRLRRAHLVTRGLQLISGSALARALPPPARALPAAPLVRLACPAPALLVLRKPLAGWPAYRSMHRSGLIQTRVRTQAWVRDVSLSRRLLQAFLPCPHAGRLPLRMTLGRGLAELSARGCPTLTRHSESLMPSATCLSHHLLQRREDYFLFALSCTCTGDGSGRIKSLCDKLRLQTWHDVDSFRHTS